MIGRKLNRKIQLYTSGMVSNGYGGQTVTESLIGHYWASIDKIGNTTRFKDMGLSELQNSVQITMRRNSEVDLNASNIFLKYKTDRYSFQKVDDQDIEKNFVVIIAEKEKSTSTIAPVTGGGGGFPFTFT